MKVFLAAAVNVASFIFSLAPLLVCPVFVSVLFLPILYAK